MANSSTLTGLRLKRQDRYEGLMRQIPVWLITEPKTGLIGAIHAARALVGG